MDGNFLLPYGEAWAYSSITLRVVLYVMLPVVPVPPLLSLVLKVVTFYGKFSLYEPNDPAYNLSIWRLEVVQKNNSTQRAILIKNLYDTELALYFLDGQE